MMIAIWLILLGISFMAIKIRYKRNWHIYYYIFASTIIPSSFGIRIAESVPIFSFNRLCFVIMLFVYLNKNNCRLGINKFFASRKKHKIFCLAILLGIIINLFAGRSGVNDLVAFLVEFCFAIIIFVSVLTPEDIDNVLKVVTAGSVILGTVALIQSATGTNLAESLFIADKSTLYIELAERLGYTRASTTMNAITYGNYCVFMFLFSMYLYRKSKRPWYAVMALLNTVCMFLSISRGAIVLWAAVVILLLIESRKNRKINKSMFAKVLIAIIAFICIYAVLKSQNNEFIIKIESVAEATLNVFNSNYSSDLINNNNALQSRLIQFTVLIWLFNQGHLLFGMGANAYSGGLLKYIHPSGKWWTLTAQDTGYVAMAGAGGVAEMLAYLLMFISLWTYFFKRRKQDDLNAMFLIVCTLLILGNLSTIFYDGSLCTVMYALMILKREKSAYIIRSVSGQ